MSSSIAYVGLQGPHCARLILASFLLAFRCYARASQQQQTIWALTQSGLCQIWSLNSRQPQPIRLCRPFGPHISTLPGTGLIDSTAVILDAQGKPAARYLEAMPPTELSCQIGDLSSVRSSPCWRHNPCLWLHLHFPHYNAQFTCHKVGTFTWPLFPGVSVRGEPRIVHISKGRLLGALVLTSIYSIDPFWATTVIVLGNVLSSN